MKLISGWCESDFNRIKGQVPSGKSIQEEERQLESLTYPVSVGEIFSSKKGRKIREISYVARHFQLWRTVKM